MARRSIGTMLVTFMVAIMVGIREGTGMAPPPPTLSTEEIEWLSPEPENDISTNVFIEDRAPVETDGDPDTDAQSRPGLIGLAMALFRKVAGRRG